LSRIFIIYGEIARLLRLPASRTLHKLVVNNDQRSTINSIMDSISSPKADLLSEPLSTQHGDGGVRCGDSPQWGWYISTTPPQTGMFTGGRENAPMLPQIPPWQPTMRQFSSPIPRSGPPIQLPIMSTYRSGNQSHPTSNKFTTGKKGGAKTNSLTGWPSVPT